MGYNLPHNLNKPVTTMTKEQFHNTLRSKGFEVFLDPEATARILSENANKVIDTLKGRGYRVETKTLSDGDRLIYIEGMYHGDRDEAFVIRANDLKTYSWRRIAL
uniref:DexA exonuclease n=1 Tax=Serratia phage Kevin TaxID=3161161 RepID=A0AAU8L0I8_9CAUD